MKENFRLLYVSLGIVAIWRGLWLLLDYVFLGIDPIFNILISILLGSVILWIGDHRLNELL